MAEVIQADRDLFKAIGAVEGWEYTEGSIDEGSWDADDAMQAIAAHRIAGQAELVEATVRKCAEIANRAYRTYNEPTDWDYGAQDACTKIEREILAALQPLSQAGEVDRG